MINGIDASWGVVEGEFGLDRPGAVTPTVIYRPLAGIGAVFRARLLSDDPTASRAMAVSKSCRRPDAPMPPPRAELLPQLVEPVRSPVRSPTIRRIRRRPSSMHRRSMAIATTASKGHQHQP